eukprot:763849-Hanusia_phi.AAC.3
MQKWYVGNKQCVALFAKYFIPSGSELTFDYDMEFYGSENVVCLCGAPKCRGTLGKPKEEERLVAGRGRVPPGKTVLGKRGKSPSGRGGREGEEGADMKAREDPYSKIYPPAQRRRADESSKPRDAEERQAQRETTASQALKQPKKSKEKRGEESQGSDSFIDSLTPKERKKQLALLRAFEKAKASKSGGD